MCRGARVGVQGDYRHEGLDWGICWAPRACPEMGTPCLPVSSPKAMGQRENVIIFHKDVHKPLEAGTLICPP